MTSNKPERTLLFLGAGFSSILGLPTTNHFNDLINGWNDKELLGLLSSFLGDDFNDIEKVLYSLESFITDQSLLNFYITKIEHNNTAYSTVKNSVSNKTQKAQKFLDHLKAGIYQILSRFEKGDALNLYYNLLQEIKTYHSGSKIGIITTNYDMTFEEAWDENESMFKKIGFEKIDYSFRENNGKMIFQENYSSSDQDIEYIKLHGSLDWSYDNRMRCIKGSTAQPLELNKHPLLYPGFKGKPSKEPFIVVHKKLKRYLQDATTVYVIGFAFRDFYINDIFENALEQNPDLLVKFYNPLSIDKFPNDSSVGHLMSISGKRFKHIEAKVENEENPLKLAEQLILADPNEII